MHQELFTDGISNINFSNGMVRIDLVSLRQSADGKNATTETVQRLILPPDGFLQAFGSMQQFVQKMVDAGVLKKNVPSKS
jgi:hypothetical protein